MLINREPAGMAHPEVPAEVAKALGMGDGFRFEHAETNYRDVGLLGDCDDQCRQLAVAAGWGAELDAIVAEVRAARGRALSRARAHPLDQEPNARLAVGPPLLPLSRHGAPQYAATATSAGPTSTGP